MIIRHLSFPYCSSSTWIFQGLHGYLEILKIEIESTSFYFFRQNCFIYYHSQFSQQALKTVGDKSKCKNSKLHSKNAEITSFPDTKMFNFIDFSDCYANLGGGMDPQSGIFRAPKAGAYMFIVHVCTADMHKALLSLR